MGLHFRLLSKNPNFKKSVVFVLASLLALFCADQFVFNNSPFSSVASGLKSNEFSCSEVIRVLRWSESRFGGAFHQNRQRLESLETASRAAELYIEKLDPSKVLFLAYEVDSFKIEMQKIWKPLIERSQCEVLDKWTQRNFSKVQSRMVKLFATLDLAALYNKKPAKELSEEEASLYENYASSENELKTRIAELIQGEAAQVSGLLAAAYGGDLKTLSWDLMSQRLFEKKWDSRALLAKVLVGQLDRFSTYFSKDEFADFYEELTGATAGLGLKLRKAPQGLLVEKVLEDSAAAQSKRIRPGDVIESVDGVPLQGLSFEEAKAVIKGPENTRIELGIASASRDGKHRKESVALFRTKFNFEEATITHKFIETKGANKRIAVVSIPSFYGRGGMGELTDERSSSEDLRRVLEEINSDDKETESLVLDLRGNPGGYLEEAVSMAGLFLGNKPVVGVVEKDKTRVLSDEQSLEPLFKKPVVVLVDEGSASASEVLSAALKDHQRAIVVGTKNTYGKGTVQKLFHLNDPLLQLGEGTPMKGGVLKLTTSVFYSPLGHTPANGGVSSDIVINSAKGIAKTNDVVAEISPLLDSEAAEVLQASMPSYRELIKMLEKKSAEHLKGSSSLDQDGELLEAAAVASDLSQK